MRRLIAFFALLLGLSVPSIFHPSVFAEGGPLAALRESLVAARARIKPGRVHAARETLKAASDKSAVEDPGNELAAESRVVSVEAICTTVQAAALANGLPIDFFTRLIWQESRFNPQAVSPAGAQGIAQFMPATAAWRGLADPFDPIEALRESAQFLRELHNQFGNLGLAAAAYNGGPKRVQDWIAKRGQLPRETQDYVRIITGRDATEWLTPETKDLAATRMVSVPCPEIARVLVEARARAMESIKQERTRMRAETAEAKWAPWGVQLAGYISEARALADFARIRKRYAAILKDRAPLLVKSRVPGRGAAYRHLVRLAEASRAGADALCNRLKAAGASCAVIRNPSPQVAGR